MVKFRKNVAKSRFGDPDLASQKVGSESCLSTEVLMIQIRTRPIYAIFLFLDFHEGISSYRRSHQPPRREHPALQKITLFNFFLILIRIPRSNWIRIQSRIRIRIHNTFKNYRYPMPRAGNQTLLKSW
jgi:hypothetical protein